MAADQRTLSGSPWTELPQGPWVLVPVGSTEQHGPHLPLDTDTVIAEAVASGVAEIFGGETLLAPAIAYGSSGEHQSFAGTSSIGGDALQHLVVELVRSMSTWAGRIVLVNAHGGNAEALAEAVVQMTREGHDVAWVPCITEKTDLHAGITETSLLLHLRPESVRVEAAEPGETRPLHEILPLMMAGGIAAVSPNGVLGDPTGATAERGERELGEMVHDIVLRLRAWRRAERGMLAVPSR